MTLLVQQGALLPYGQYIGYNIATSTSYALVHCVCNQRVFWIQLSIQKVPRIGYELEIMK